MSIQSVESTNPKDIGAISSDVFSSMSLSERVAQAQQAEAPASMVLNSTGTEHQVELAQEIIKQNPQTAAEVIKIIESMGTAGGGEKYFKSIGDKLDAVVYCKENLDTDSVDYEDMAKTLNDAHIQLIYVRGYINQMTQSAFFPSEANGDFILESEDLEW